MAYKLTEKAKQQIKYIAGKLMSKENRLILDDKIFEEIELLKNNRLSQLILRPEETKSGEWREIVFEPHWFEETE